MFKGIKDRWQRFLDGTETADRYHRLEIEPPQRGRAIEPRPVSAIAKRNPYAELAPARLNPQPSHQVRVRQYEDAASAWARDTLREFDESMARARTEMARFVQRTRDNLGRSVPRRDHETPQYERRHARNMAVVAEDVPDLKSEDDVKVIAQRILERADRASSPEVTGLIPVITDDMTEEAWS